MSLKEDENTPETTTPVLLCSPDLTGKQRRTLRALGHSLKPSVWVGRNGVTENLVENVESALLAHELIKVKLGKDTGLTMGLVASELHGHTEAQVAQIIGRTMLLYKPHPEKPTIKLSGGS